MSTKLHADVHAHVGREKTSRAWVPGAEDGGEGAVRRHHAVDHLVLLAACRARASPARSLGQRSGHERVHVQPQPQGPWASRRTASLIPERLRRARAGVWGCGAQFPSLPGGGGGREHSPRGGVRLALRSAYHRQHQGCCQTFLLYTMILFDTHLRKKRSTVLPNVMAGLVP